MLQTLYYNYNYQRFTQKVEQHENVILMKSLVRIFHVSTEKGDFLRFSSKLLTTQSK